MDNSSDELPASRKRQHSSPSSINNEHDLKRTKVDDIENITNVNVCDDSEQQEENTLKTELLNTTESELKTDISRQDIKECKNLGEENKQNCEDAIGSASENSIDNKLEDKLQTKNNSETNEIVAFRNLAIEEKNEEHVDETKIINLISTKDQIREEKNRENIALEKNKNEEGGEKQTIPTDNNESIENQNSPKETNDPVEYVISDSDEEVTKSSESNTPTKMKSDLSAKKLTPKQLKRKLAHEKRKQEKQKEKEERMKRRLEEQLKRKEVKDKEQKEKELKKKELEKERELKKKEKEEREEKKRKEKEEKEQKRKEKEEKEEQKRKEREEEKLKKLQEIEEKNREKLKEEEKKQKAAAAFVNFFVPKKTDDAQDIKKTQTSNFLQFEVKSDMKLPLPRRDYLTKEQKDQLDLYLENQDTESSYLKDLSSGKIIGKSLKTWPYEESTEDDVVIVDLGESIFEEKSQKYRGKFLYFHENRRPAYYGTWRKKSTVIKPRKPFAEDQKVFNYEEDSDDDWEEEEQGESLNASEDEAEKENEDEKDDYEVDNEFFVPHGHLSDDEIDDEEMARLSPESLKQKLMLLKEEFDHDMQSKTHKLKPRSIGCIWYNKDSSNVEEAVDRYLQPLAIISRNQIIIKKRDDILLVKEKKKIIKELDSELIPRFLKMIHGSSCKKSVLVDKFLTAVENNGNITQVSKRMLVRTIRKYANWEKYRDEETKRFKFRWCVNQDMREKYDLTKVKDDCR
ncbi:chromatin assembly factor 1 subunit A [Diorhabda carinulata]|uniref:chromatin assembly factor 1 subunit A n=1 Tax=Diorhabda carinulata TaxID=1163345 RepID=UPI0025A018C2|nr:chromatin assembly factor 1 subunit A [Diorhabda carinulata]